VWIEENNVKDIWIVFQALKKGIALSGIKYCSISTESDVEYYMWLQRKGFIVTCGTDKV
jgi:hypothetical protein